MGRKITKDSFIQYGYFDIEKWNAKQFQDYIKDRLRSAESCDNLVDLLEVMAVWRKLSLPRLRTIVVDLIKVNLLNLEDGRFEKYESELEDDYDEDEFAYD